MTQEKLYEFLKAEYLKHPLAAYRDLDFIEVIIKELVEIILINFELKPKNSRH